MAANGGQFTLVVKNWQEAFVHKWDTSLKVTEWIDKMYYDPPTESTVSNSFPSGAFPEYELNCTQLSNGAWHCSPLEQQSDSFVELGVVCKNYKDLYNECSMNCTLPVATTQSSTIQQGKLTNTRDFTPLQLLLLQFNCGSNYSSCIHMY